MDRSEQEALVHRLVEMDEQAWQLFCSEYTSALFGFVRFAFQCNAEAAEQVVQMTFVRCVKSLHTFDAGRGDLYGWLKAVARNEGYSLLRRNGQSHNTVSLSVLPEAIQNQLLNELDTVPLPDELLAREDVRILVQSVLLSLNSRYREALVLKYLEGYSVADIASRLGISEKAAESSLSRARNAFREAFSEAITAEGARTCDG